MRHVLLSYFILLVAPSMLLAQESPQDVRDLQDPDMPVSDDPRRLPRLPGPRGPDRTLVLYGGLVFDGTGAAATERTVVLRRNRIEALLPADSQDWPSGAEVRDVDGMMILPGLIDLHVHVDQGLPLPRGDRFSWGYQAVRSPEDAALRGAEILRFYIESGITSVRGVGSQGDVAFRLKDWVAQNRLPGSRVFPAGRAITGRGGEFPAVTGPETWRGLVRDQFHRGADLIKLHMPFTKEEAAAAIDEAHALGIRVTVDSEAYYTQWAVEAGVDSIEHVLPLADETIRLMAEKGVANIPTLAVMKYQIDAHGGIYDSYTMRTWDQTFESILDVGRRLKEAGIKLGVGLDLVWDWNRMLPTAYIDELKYFTQIGYSIPETLVAATKTNAEILHMGDLLGTVEPGKLADIVVVKGRPDRNLDDLANVEWVIRDGYTVVENGRVVIEPHRPMPTPSSARGESPTP